MFRLPPREEDLAGLTSSFPFLARDKDGISKDTLGWGVWSWRFHWALKRQKQKPDGVSNWKNLMQVAYTRR